MRGLFVDGGEVRFRDDLPAPADRPGHSRVRVLRAGICATDLALQRGYMGFRGIPGHEFVGTALDGPHRGRRVVGEINAACGVCAKCRGGLGRHCPERSVLGILNHSGAFADQIVLPDANLHAVPDNVSTDAATFAEPLAAAFEIPEQVPLHAGARGLVAGDGRLGLLCAHVLHRHGVDVTVAGRHPERARLLPDGVQFAEGLLDAEHRRAPIFDVAVEATGNADVLPRVIQLVQPRGTIVLKTTTERPTTIDLSLAVVNELSLVGSRCGPFEPAVASLASGSIPVERFVEARFALEDGAAAFERAAQAGTLKVLVDVAD